MNEWTRDTLRIMGQMSGATVALAVTVGLGAWIGLWADRRWGTDPWCTTAGVMLGLAAGFLQIWEIYRRFLKN